MKREMGFTTFIRRYGKEELLDCLERNEKNGVISYIIEKV